MDKKAHITLAAAALVLISTAAIYFYIDQKGGVPKINSFEECAKAGYPIMESYPRQCRTPDGRNFVEIIEEPKGDQVALKEGERDGSVLVQKIYPTYITGLNYREYPLAIEKGFPITMYIGDTASNGCTVTMKLIRIEGKAAVFVKTIDESRPCPICLGEGVLIDTPTGKIEVQKLRAGMEVWTTNELGDRVIAKILKTSRTPVPATHQMVNLVLVDGRELLASPGHPTADGRVIGELTLGEIIDGSKIISVERVSYEKEFTYDLLPNGSTGSYWANGILVGGTLLK